MERPEPISIVVVTDNNYAVLLAALIRSLEVNHHTGEKLDIYVVDDGISAKSKRQLMQSASPAVTTLHWIPISTAIPPGTKLPVDTTSWPQNIYTRFFVPHFVPEAVRKVLFIDVDMVLQEDISKLWNVDLGANVIGAVVDPNVQTVGNSWGGVKNYRALGLNPEAGYLNAGMLVIDAEKWRRSNYTDKLLKCVKDNMDYCIFPDQYALNVVFAGKWLALDKRWNTFASEAIPDPFIIHFIAVKPIYKGYVNNRQYQQIFFEYLNATAFRDVRDIHILNVYLGKARHKLGKMFRRAFHKLSLQSYQA